MELVAEGLTNREIAEKLYISETVKKHISNIMSKLGLKIDELAADRQFVGLGAQIAAKDTPWDWPGVDNDMARPPHCGENENRPGRDS